MTHLNSKLTKKRTNRAFTLLELLVVVGILAIITGVAITNFQGNRIQTERHFARETMIKIKTALLAFREDMGAFPNEADLAPVNLDIPLDTFGGSGKINSTLTARNTGGVSSSDQDLWSGDLPNQFGEAASDKSIINFWALFNKPVDIMDPTRYDVNKDTGLGWHGPYLRIETNHRYDEQSRKYGNIFAIGDNIPATTRVGSWFTPLLLTPEQKKSPLTPRFRQVLSSGNPIRFVKTSGGYYLHSFGHNGLDDDFAAATFVIGTSPFDDLWIFVAPLNPSFDNSGPLPPAPPSALSIDSSF